MDGWVDVVPRVKKSIRMNCFVKASFEALSVNSILKPLDILACGKQHVFVEQEYTDVRFWCVK